VQFVAEISEFDHVDEIQNLRQSNGDLQESLCRQMNDQESEFYNEENDIGVYK